MTKEETTTIAKTVKASTFALVLGIAVGAGLVLGHNFAEWIWPPQNSQIDVNYKLCDNPTVTRLDQKGFE